MTIISAAKDGLTKFFPQDGRKRLPAFTSVVQRNNMAYGICVSGAELQLGIVPPNASLKSWDKYEVVYEEQGV